MLNTKTSQIIAAVVLLVVGLVVGKMLFPGTASLPLSGVTNYDIVDTTDGYRVDGVTVIDGSGNFVIGTTGTSIDQLNTGVCYIKAYATTIAATTTATVDCQGTAAIGTITAAGSALTGITSGDRIVATLATSTAGTVTNGLVITGVSASTTAGYITMTISNLTGSTYTWPLTGTATGTAYYFSSR